MFVLLSCPSIFYSFCPSHCLSPSHCDLYSVVLYSLQPVKKA
nr:MAG TPA: hypothetical protein [Caudoviricetes sp.]